MKPDFRMMTRKELRAYILEHREDDEAFHAYMDKVNAEPATKVYSAPQSIDDLRHFPLLPEKFHQERED